MYKIREHPLGVKEDIALSVHQDKMLRALENYDLWFVTERLEKKGLVDVSVIDSAIAEFRRYMALVGLGYTALGMTSPEVDQVWHNFILFTEEYADFCLTIFGRFIHHRPETSRSPMSPDYGEKFVTAYTHVFGSLPALWLGGESSCQDSGGGDSCRSCHYYTPDNSN